MRNAGKNPPHDREHQSGGIQGFFRKLADLAAAVRSSQPRNRLLTSATNGNLRCDRLPDSSLQLLYSRPRTSQVARGCSCGRADVV
jgi:hypothetical protein